MKGGEKESWFVQMLQCLTLQAELKWQDKGVAKRRDSVKTKKPNRDSLALCLKQPKSRCGRGQST